MERVIRGARNTAVASALIGLAALAPLEADSGWWALGLTFLFVACPVAVGSGALWLTLLIVRGRASSPSHPVRVSAPTGASKSRIPAISEVAKRAEVERLRSQLDSTLDEWNQLRVELRRLEFELSVRRESAPPLDYVHFAHWRVLDAEYRKRVEELDGLVRALTGTPAAA